MNYIIILEGMKKVIEMSKTSFRLCHWTKSSFSAQVDWFRKIIVSFSNEIAVSDIMNSNQKFDVSLDGTPLSHTMNLNAFVLTPAVQI